MNVLNEAIAYSPMLHHARKALLGDVRRNEIIDER